MLYPKEMQEAIDMVLCCVEGQVFSNGDSEYLQVLIILNDDSGVVRISADGSTEESYLSTEPIRTLVSVREDTFTVNDLPELEGFTTGFTC